MDRIKVAAVQLNALRDDLDHNLALHDRFAREAAADGCALVMFPELSVTAHFGDPAATAPAEPASSGRIYETMRSLAADLGIVISYGFCESAHGSFYNAQALMGPDGLIGVQRKVHASGDEYFYFRMGRSLNTFDIGFCRVGTLICYDVLFFEAWRTLALKGAEVILMPHAARSGRGTELPVEEQQKVIKEQLGNTKNNTVYAEANGAFAVFANQYGYNGHSTHSGGAYIIAPDGTIIAQGEPVLEDTWISAELDPQVQYDVRNRSGHPLRMRRPEVYGELTRMI